MVLRRRRVSPPRKEITQQHETAGDRVARRARSTVYGHLDKTTVGKRPAAAQGERLSEKPASVSNIT